MYAHLLLTGDLGQHRQWAQRVEKMEQAGELTACDDSQERALVARADTWRIIRSMSWWATGLTLLYCGLETASLVQDYAVGFGFGWARALTYLLPLPLAWAAGRRLFQNGVLSNMKYLGANPPMERRAKGWVRAALTGAIAGFGAMFVLNFLQGLISWFMTPAPTLMMELYLDVYNAVNAGVWAGGLGAVLFPLLSRSVPARGSALPEGQSGVAKALPAS
jgi:hypothetical protein